MLLNRPLSLLLLVGSIFLDHTVARSLQTRHPDADGTSVSHGDSQPLRNSLVVPREAPDDGRKTVSRRSAKANPASGRIVQRNGEGSMEPNSIYITLNERGADQPGSFHWGILLTHADGTSTYYHATNRDTNIWRFETRSGNPMSSASLVALYKIAPLQAGQETRAVNAIHSVPADGQPSRKSGQTFNCKNWTMDVLLEMQSQGIFHLLKGVYDIEFDAAWYARTVEAQVRARQRNALVINDTKAT